MTLEDLQASEWYNDRPQIVKDAIDKCPPIYLWALPSGKQCTIYSFSEPNTEKGETECTCTVTLTGKGGPLAELGLDVLSTYSVFGIKLDDLTLISKEI